MDNNITILKGKLDNENFNNICRQMFKCLEFIHTKGVVHRDIKPNNFLIKNNKIKLCDFGFSKQIIIKKKFINESKIDKIIGTINYISVNVHDLIDPSMRDDIESAIYIIYYLLEKLEWVSKNKNMTIEEIYEKKKNFSNKIIDYIRSLEFSQIPEYSKLFHHLKFEYF